MILLVVYFKWKCLVSKDQTLSRRIFEENDNDQNFCWIPKGAKFCSSSTTTLLLCLPRVVLVSEILLTIVYLWHQTLYPGKPRFDTCYRDSYRDVIERIRSILDDTKQIDAIYRNYIVTANDFLYGDPWAAVTISVG